MIAMSEIQSTLRPKIADLIQRQRLGYLTAGSMFAKYSHKGTIEKIQNHSILMSQS